MRKIFHGYHVGYGNAAQFTREYKRLFGMPPMRDIPTNNKEVRK